MTRAMTEATIEAARTLQDGRDPDHTREFGLEQRDDESS